jgi:hypothetical protein
VSGRTYKLNGRLLVLETGRKKTSADAPYKKLMLILERVRATTRASLKITRLKS